MTEIQRIEIGQASPVIWIARPKEGKEPGHAMARVIRWRGIGKREAHTVSHIEGCHVQWEEGEE